MSEHDIEQMAKNVRRHALREAAKLMCVFCANEIWSDASCIDGTLYQHYERLKPSNLRPCYSGKIWKLIDAE